MLYHGMHRGRDEGARGGGGDGGGGGGCYHSAEVSQFAFLVFSTLTVVVASQRLWYHSTTQAEQNRARMHHKVVGNFGSEADVRSLCFRHFRFNETSDNGACTHGRPAK